MKSIEKQNIFKYLYYYLDKDKFKCSICFENVDIFYIICKSNCIDNSYCKQCIEKIEKESKRCPFTNTLFTYKDISIDYRKNRSLESFKEIHKIFLNKKIAINIDFS